MVRSLEELSQEFYENKYVTNFILLVAQENRVSFVPSEPSIKSMIRQTIMFRQQFLIKLSISSYLHLIYSGMVEGISFI